MFMAEKPIITEEVKKQSNMAFKMRSGNKVSFENMGSSPARNMKDGSYEHSFESPAKQKAKHRLERDIDLDVPREGSSNTIEQLESEYSKRDDRNKASKKAEIGKSKVDLMQHLTGVNKNKTGEKIEKRRTDYLKSLDESPAKQKIEKGQGKLVKGQGELKKQTNSWKGTEGQDQDKIFNDKGEHIGDYVNDKPVMKLKELVQKEPKYIEAQIPPGFKRPVVKKGMTKGISKLTQKEITALNNKMKK